MEYKVIDVHTHIWPEKLADRAVRHVGDYYSYDMHGKGTMADLVESTKEAGVEKFVIHSSALKSSQVEDVNNATASHITENIAGFGTLHPEYEDFEKEIDRIVSLGLKGIKLHPDFQFFNIDDRRMYGAYEILRDKKLPILFHMGDVKYDYSSAVRLIKIMQDFPGIVVIGAHLGGHLKWEQTEEYLIGKDLFMDCSSTSRKLSPERIKSIISRHGTE
ncbi:MAG: amidohydrolase family protein, partial [Clostridia bacterium]|nr:amidohydrolase family protein [Clostridia bacterium]